MWCLLWLLRHPCEPVGDGQLKKLPYQYLNGFDPLN